MHSFSRNLFVVAGLAALGIAGANAAGNGSSPKGKPFVSINNQIVEVTGAVSSIQDQLDLLVARVDTVEQRVAANDVAIATLQAQNTTLSVLIAQNATDIGSINAQILLLQQANVNLQTQITGTGGDVSALQAQVASNNALIASLQQAILLANQNIITLGTGLQSQIDNNNALITALQAEVAQINAQLLLKQNLVDGICPDGSAVRQVLASGSVICQGVGGASGQLESVTSWQNADVLAFGSAHAIAYCPSGYTVTGSGFYAWGTSVYANWTNSSNHGNSVLVAVRNYNSYSNSFASVATCTRIAP